MSTVPDPLKLPRFSANERRPFPQAFSRQISKNRWESVKKKKVFLISREFPKKGKDCVVACGAQNFLQTRLERETPGRHYKRNGKRVP
jgi:hypothetical protein